MVLDENRSAREFASVPEIIGVSAAVARVRAAVVLAARSEVNVLIAGETGTGKELVARAIHRLWVGNQGPFVAHNCATTSSELFDSEFFGHRRGAFTGADRDRAGIFKEAHGGILFLDELECLNLVNQAKLLRVLDDGQVRPLGSERSNAVHVRILAATNRAPSDMLAAGQLRMDLYYRLRGFEVRLPALRERCEDIEVLTQHFLRPFGKRASERALRALSAAPWPGNVRELRIALARACAVAEGSTVEVQHLELQGPVLETSALGVTVGLSSDTPMPHNLQALARRAIVDALRAHHGNRTRAADALGIHRSTLRRRMRELRIDGTST